MIAIIAGSGALPKIAAETFKSRKENFFVVQINENDAWGLMDGVEVVHPQVKSSSGILKFLKSRQVKKVLFVGKVNKLELLKNSFKDWLSIKLLASACTFGDQELLNVLTRFLKKEGFEVLSQKELFKNLIVSPGVLCGKLTEKIKEDIDFGMRIASVLAENDVGQTVVVKNKNVLAVEASEGTTYCIRRGIDLGGGGVVVCKTSRKTQSDLYDLPTIGRLSIENVVPEEISAISWNSQRTLVVDVEGFVERAKHLGVSLVSKVCL